jgi:hypothetical protein
MQKPRHFRTDTRGSKPSRTRSAAAKLLSTVDRIALIDSASPDDLELHPGSIKGYNSFHDVRFNYPSSPSLRVSILNSLLERQPQRRERMAKEKEKEVEDAIAEKPLRRTNTNKSLKQKKLQQGGTGEKEYGMLYIMGRMSRINRESWKL